MKICILPAALPALALLAASSLSAVPALTFVPLTPCRVVDTRVANGDLGSPDVMPGTRDFPILSGICGLPATAVSYSLNVTVVPKTNLRFLTIYAAGDDQPTTSTLNAVGGDPVANGAVVKAGTNGAVRVFTTDETDVVLDVNGYYIEAPAAVPGPQGPAGPVGANGPQGPAGSAGATGSQGPAGTPGTPGPQGIPGLPGINGVNGTNGTNGATGAAGPVVYSASLTSVAFGSSFAPLSGLNMSSGATESSTQVAAGTSCSSVSITQTSIGRGSSSLFSILRKNGVTPSPAPQVILPGNGTLTTTVPLTIVPGDLLNLQFLTSGGSPTGTTYVTVACQP